MKKTILILGAISLMGISACKKQDKNATNNPIEENELITSVALTFIDTDASLLDTFHFEWNQPKGPGTTITVDTIKLKSNKTYQGFVSISDKSKTPSVDITEEIEAAANEHRFFYNANTSRLKVHITDADSQLLPMEVGLKFNAITNTNGSAFGLLNVVLKHYTAASPKSGGLSNGSTDIDVSFPVKIE